MEQLKTRITVGGIIIIALLGWIAFKPVPMPNIGSTSQGGEYHYTHLTGAIATTTLIQTGQTTLGSIIITEDSAVAVTLYDATSTSAYSITNGTKIGVLQAALTEGVYTFDVVAPTGLVMQASDGFTFAGDWTVTYR